MVSLIAIGGVSVKKLIFIVGACVLWFASASADQYVNGYTKSNGTYVEGHFRGTPNNTQVDNYSAKGNSNPYTGEKGYSDPYKNNNGQNYNVGSTGSKKQ